MEHTFSEEIMKACDIRGIYPQELDERDAYHIGRAFGTIMAREGRTTCALGYDGRESSPQLADELSRGLRDSGIKVFLLGVLPSPAVYIAVQVLAVDAGVVVTASHNPAEYNGVKFLLSDRLFHGDSIQELGKISKEGSYNIPMNLGEVVDMDFTDTYINYLVGFLDIKQEKKLKIVWDPGNGAVAAVIHQLTQQIPGEHVLICSELDSRFPNHHPDPSLPENLSLLRKTVLETRADFGVAFDGDGDRIGVVSASGRILQGDQLLVLFAREHLSQFPGDTIMSEVKASTFFYEEIVRAGGKPLMWKVGHTNQKEKMVQEGISLAGETSGHIFFAENFGFDDGLFAAIKLINRYAKSALSLEDEVSQFPHLYDSGEIRLELPREQRAYLVADIIDNLQANNRDVVTLDGVRVSCADGFWMLRGSNTQPHVTIRCEGRSKEGLDICMEDLRRHIAHANIDMDAVTVYREKPSFGG